MEGLIFLAWICLLAGIPLFLIGTASKVYIESVRAVEILARLVFSVLVYAVLTLITFYLMFAMIFLLAHSESGNGLTALGKILFVGIVLFYAVMGWLLCSVVNGSLIKPWALRDFDSQKPLSIIERK